jgi:formimidoylglutamate deiminase
MYTQSSRSSSLWFATALLPTGWTDRVRITVAAGRIDSIDVDVEPAASDERHAIAVAGVGNVHSHAFQRALAGLTERRDGADSFWSWREAMYALVARLTPSQLEAIAAQAYLEMLESGITRVGEFHYVHHTNDGAPYADIAELANRIVAAASTSGIGLTLLPVFYAHGGVGGQEPKPTQRRFANSLDAYVRLFEASNRAIKSLPFANLGIAAHSVRAVTPEELLALTHIEHGGPMHIHIAEQLAEVEQWQQWAGARPVEWLLDHVKVDERWCLVHATHVSASEVDRMVASGATVGLCPVTEANLGDGVFPAKQFVANHGRFGIGTDSNVRIDVAEELRLLEYGQRLQHRERNVLHSNARVSTGRFLFDTAVAGGAYALRSETGRLAPGFVADIVTLNEAHPSLAHRRGDELLDSWVFTGAPIVDCVWSAGVKVVTDGRHRDRDRIARNYIEVLHDLRD